MTDERLWGAVCALGLCPRLACKCLPWSNGLGWVSSYSLPLGGWQTVPDFTCLQTGNGLGDNSLGRGGRGLRDTGAGGGGHGGGSKTDSGDFGSGGDAAPDRGAEGGGEGGEIRRFHGGCVGGGGGGGRG